MAIKYEVSARSPGKAWVKLDNHDTLAAAKLQANSALDNVTDWAWFDVRITRITERALRSEAHVQKLVERNTKS